MDPTNWNQQQPNNPQIDGKINLNQESNLQQYQRPDQTPQLQMFNQLNSQQQMRLLTAMQQNNFNGNINMQLYQLQQQQLQQQLQQHLQQQMLQQQQMSPQTLQQSRMMMYPQMQNDPQDTQQQRMRTTSNQPTPRMKTPVQMVNLGLKQPIMHASPQYTNQGTPMMMHASPLMNTAQAQQQQTQAQLQAQAAQLNAKFYKYNVNQANPAIQQRNQYVNMNNIQHKNRASINPGAIVKPPISNVNNVNTTQGNIPAQDSSLTSSQNKRNEQKGPPLFAIAPQQSSRCFFQQPLHGLLDQSTIYNPSISSTPTLNQARETKTVFSSSRDIITELMPIAANSGSNKRKLQDLISQIDPTEKLTADAEKVTLY
jgi:hypothetical protein